MDNYRIIRTTTLEDTEIYLRCFACNTFFLTSSDVGPFCVFVISRLRSCLTFVFSDEAAMAVRVTCPRWFVKVQPGRT